MNLLGKIVVSHFPNMSSAVSPWEVHFGSFPQTLRNDGGLGRSINNRNGAPESSSLHSIVSEGNGVPPSRGPCFLWGLPPPTLGPLTLLGEGNQGNAHVLCNCTPFAFHAVKPRCLPASEEGHPAFSVLGQEDGASKRWRRSFFSSRPGTRVTRVGLYLQRKFQLGQITKGHPVLNSREVHLIWNSLANPQEPNTLRNPSSLQWGAVCGSAHLSLQFIATSLYRALESESRHSH